MRRDDKAINEAIGPRVKRPGCGVILQLHDKGHFQAEVHKRGVYVSISNKDGYIGATMDLEYMRTLVDVFSTLLPQDDSDVIGALGAAARILVEERKEREDQIIERLEQQFDEGVD